MKVLHVVHSLIPEAGGNAKVVAELTENLAKRGITTSIFTTIMEKDEQENLFQPKGVGLFVSQQSFLARWWPYYSPELKKNIMKEMSKFDIIHIHDIWHYPNFAASRIAKRAGKPYIISTHGTLEPWALKYKGLRKRIYMALVQRRILQEAAAIHAVTSEEVKHIQSFGIDNGIAMIPNGISPEEFQDLPSRKDLEQLYPGLQENRVILFLGRIHPKKGLDLLAKTFGKIARERDDVCLLIAGPNKEGYQAHIEKMLQTEGVLDKVVFTGMINGYEKMAVLNGADIFILPSYSEGFSIAVLEAMICGLPVIITRQCNFPEVAEANAGIIIEPDVDQLANSLTKLLNEPQLRKEMGENGKHLVMEKYTWDKIAEKMMELYQTILMKN
jgi:glycosyltransferase involved in cell wall biosynthesis